MGRPLGKSRCKVCLQETAESERRLEKLEAQVADTQIDAPVFASMGNLQERIDVLQKERDALLAAATQFWHDQCGWEMVSLDNIPLLPSTNVQDVEHWLNCRNCEMRNALEYGEIVAAVWLHKEQQCWPIFRKMFR